MVKTVDVLGVPHACELTSPQSAPTVLVFVHGWLLSRGYWEPVIQKMASQYQCLSYDLRGFGDSQPDRISGASSQTANAKELAIVSGSGRSAQGTVAMSDKQHPSDKEIPCNTSASRYTPASYAQDLVELLEQFNITNAWLVGHSLGGSISLWAADLAPDRIQGVVCVNSGGGIYLKEEFERFRSAGEQLVKMRPRWLCHLPLVDLLMTRLNVVQPIDRRWGRQRLIDLVMADSEAALGTLLDSTTEEEVHCLPRVVSRLKQPVHFVAGANDTIMEPQYVRHLASFHPSFDYSANNVTEILNCGHLAMVEQPIVLSEILQNVLSQHGS